MQGHSQEPKGRRPPGPLTGFQYTSGTTFSPSSGDELLCAAGKEVGWNMADFITGSKISPSEGPSRGSHGCCIPLSHPQARTTLGRAPQTPQCTRGNVPLCPGTPYGGSSVPSPPSPHLYRCFVGLQFDCQRLPDPQVLHIHQGSALTVHAPRLAALLGVFCLEAERWLSTDRVRQQIHLLET